ncbi:MAG: NusG domain II-containing protein [Clostridia bacterium]|nr:NusG domain II-containing protein [Clostridia bacterium]
MFKKGDKLVIIFCAFFIVLSFVLLFFLKSPGKTIVVTKDNKQVYKGQLSSDKKINLDKNTVVIKDGAVFMEYSSCKNQICVKHKRISEKGESIICLPNKVIIEIK